MKKTEQRKMNNVLRRMLNTPPKPHESDKESSEPRRRGRPIGGGSRTSQANT